VFFVLTVLLFVEDLLDIDIFDLEVAFIVGTFERESVGFYLRFEIF
jgi:hypothetical protein